VAVIASMMRGHQVEAIRATLPGKTGVMETAEQARDRIMDVVRGSRVEFTLKICRPERVGLKWVRRGK